MAAQIILMVLFVVSLCLGANQHGKLKTGCHSFWIGLIAVAIHTALLYWGGFFDCWR